MRILYDSFFKEVMNVEIQKIGYMFPGPRCACYSADLLLRQYKRVRDRKRDKFSYKDIRDVYLIVIYEQSPPEFKAHPDVYHHSGTYVFNTGLEMDMLQNYVMIPLDIFRKCMQNKTIENRLEAWLTFLSEDRPEKIIELITACPEFKAMYQTLYDMCLNVERVMRMFSRELAEMDRNTVKLMIEENQRIIDEQQKQMSWQQEQLDQQQEQLSQAQEKLAQKEEQLALLQKELEAYRRRG